MCYCLSYLQAYEIIRAAGGTGSGNGPIVSYHDAFFGAAKWAGWLPGADRIALDLHTYVCFGPQSDQTIAEQVQKPCAAWGAMMNTSMGAFGLTAAGEFSNAVTDCGKWVNGVGLGARYDGTMQDETGAGMLGLVVVKPGLIGRHGTTL